MHKKGVLIFLLFVSFISIAIAQNASTNNPSSNSGNTNFVAKAYQCLQSQVESKAQSSISLQEAVFGVLALGGNSKLISVIESKAVSGNHWQESSNPLKDTAQGLLAYNRIGRNTNEIKSWILSKSKPATELTWYIEIDIENHESSGCNLSYSNEQQRSITINEDMTISGNPGSCLSIAQEGFWLRVANTCIDYNYTISCNKDFTTSTLYQRTGSSTIYVSPVAHSTSALGTTTERINSKCLTSSSTSCDYEGTLWATIALDKLGLSVSEYIPYLLALSESNKKFLPSSLLHILTDGQDQYSELVQQQQQLKFWEAPNTPYNRYYDSALAILSLQGTNSAEETNSKKYFETITTSEGCWNNNNIRDTGFLLYAGESRAVAGPGPGPSPADPCEPAGYYCTSALNCAQLEGEVLNEYLCPGTKECCSKAPALQSCSALSGKLCLTGEVCSGSTQKSTEGTCCLGTCGPAPQTNECTTAGGTCDDSCLDIEEQIPSSCPIKGNVCCRVKSTSSESSGLGVWMILLIILIILVVVGILFRNKLKMMLFKSRNNKSPASGGPSRPSPPGRPPFPPYRGPMPYPRAQPRIISPSSTPPIRRPLSSKDKEMEDTMAKLKEMSK
ncbi:hypothetical protein FJZ21_01310 [Candidatus Pacearchaeota archaeon]|nr:hypothetical protein [Candidatus Pacearchaeota archaeon]